MASTAVEAAADPGWQYLRPPPDKSTVSFAKRYSRRNSCWIPDAQEGFIGADVKSSSDTEVTVITWTGIEKKARKEEIQEMNPPQFHKTENMANLTFLNDAGVLHNLRERYHSMLIYTYSGLFCVVINPYKKLPIYTESIVRLYMGKRRNEMPPHIFAIAEEAFQNMTKEKVNQSILITGESGAGKTENTKQVIFYLAKIGSIPLTEQQPEKTTLERQILHTNPVLEAFGNAKTVRNDNSSRFGKYIRVCFDEHGKLAGADIVHYLLEKIRVVKQSVGERSFHIFYQIMSGGIEGLKEKLFLRKNITAYGFVSQAEVKIDGVDDATEMKNTDAAFDVMGFEQSEKDNLYKLTAAIMHMGEMKFKQRPREEQAETDGTEEIELVCKLLEIDSNVFLKALLQPQVKVGSGWMSRCQNLNQVTWAVGALAKAIYSRMFLWLIQRCNKSLDMSEQMRKYFIGVLDIAGFEIFNLNSFEQLWINFVNEKLQQYFNHHMFVLEQEEYCKEKIAWEFIDFGLDLQACIDLIEKPLGILSMLDEECIVPRANDTTFVQKLMDQHLGKHPNFQKAKPRKRDQADAHFAIVHYAGTVRYNVGGWLEKNKDPLNESIIAAMKNSSRNKLLLEIWSDFMTRNDIQKQGHEAAKKIGRSSSFQTVSMMHRENLANLMNMLNNTQPHFIRCIVPNEKKKCGLIDANLVMNQLTCNGVLEGIRICRKGYPNRMPYSDFSRRYSMLAADSTKSLTDAKDITKIAISHLVTAGTIIDEEHQLGTTKVFFKAGVLARLEDARNTALTEFVTGVQTHIRWYLAQIKYRKKVKERDAYLIIQRNVRMWLKLREWQWWLLYRRVKAQAREVRRQSLLSGEFDSRIQDLEEKLKTSELATDELKTALNMATTENTKLKRQLDEQMETCMKLEGQHENCAKMQANLNDQLEEAQEALTVYELKNKTLHQDKVNQASELEALKDENDDLRRQNSKLKADMQNNEREMDRNLQAIAQQEDQITKLNKERKNVEEWNAKLTGDLQIAEEKVNAMNKAKSKLEQSIDELEASIEKERRFRQDAEKFKRKTDGDLKVLQENMSELSLLKQDLQAKLVMKEDQLVSAQLVLEKEQNAVLKLHGTLKGQQCRIDELEEELERTEQARLKADKIRAEMQAELEELTTQLDEAGGLTKAQTELAKNREGELAKLRRGLEEAKLQHDTETAALRKKCSDTVAELNDQIVGLQKAKARFDKERAALQRQADESQAAADTESKKRANAEKQCKQLELQLAEVQLALEDANRRLTDVEASRSKVIAESEELGKRLEEVESKLFMNEHSKHQLEMQLESLQASVEEDNKAKQNLSVELRNALTQVDCLKGQLEEETDNNADLQRHLTRANAEIQQWRAKYETEILGKMEEMQDVKKKLVEKLHAAESEIESYVQKINSLEKIKQQLQAEVQDAISDAESANNFAQAIERKYRNIEKIVEDWKRKYEEVNVELASSQKEVRSRAGEVFRLEAALEEATEKEEALRRENKNLTEELHSINEQLGQGGNSFNEIQKQNRRLELEKQELQNTVDETMAQLESEEIKFSQCQLEIAQLKQDMENRLVEKEEEFQNTRRNHQRALDSMQASLEAESRARNDLARLKKKLESDVTTYEVALEQANRANAEAQKNLKSYQEQVKQLQSQIEEEQKAREELREGVEREGRRVHSMQLELTEISATLETCMKQKRQTEVEAEDAKIQINELQASNNSLAANNRKFENELQMVQGDMEELMSQLKEADEKAKKAVLASSKLSEELQKEQEHSQHLEERNRSLEQQITQMHNRLDDAEANAARGGKRVVEKLEMKVRDLENELKSVQRNYQELDKERRRSTREIKELQYQVSEDRKNEERLQDLINKLQQKLKVYKRQMEEMEQSASTNLSKYRQALTQLQDAEERADMAENSLVKYRSRSRLNLSQSPSFGGIYRSASSTVYSRSSLNFSRSASAMDVMREEDRNESDED